MTMRLRRFAIARILVGVAQIRPIFALTPHGGFFQIKFEIYPIFPFWNNGRRKISPPRKDMLKQLEPARSISRIIHT